MGLDGVELLMAVEEEFGLRISDEDGARMITVGDMHDYVVAQLRARGEMPSEEAIWQKVREIIIEQLGIRPEQVVRSADFVRDLGVG